MKKLSFVFAAAFAVGMFGYSALAEVLVYEGFAKSDYDIGEAAGNQGTATSYPGANVSAIGTSTDKWQGLGGSQIKVYGSYYGLSLPASLTQVGFTATGGSIGTNNGSSNSDLRGMYHSLATDVLKVSNGKLFVRMLLSIDSKAAGKLNVKTGPVNASGGYYGFGVMKAPGGNDYSLLCQTKSPSAIGFGIWKGSDGCNLSLMLTDVAGASTNYEVIHGISMDTTYICYAELSIGTGANGAEVVRAGAQTIADYQSPVTWANIGGESDSIEVDVISDTVYPNAMGVVGPYGSDGGFFRGDELRIGTQIDDVLVDAVAGAPQLTVATLSGANGSYTVSDTVVKASATDAGAIAEDSDGTFVKFSAGDAAENDPFTATIDISRLSADTTYQLYSFAENDVAAATNKAGIIYNGNLSIVKVKDANEYQREAGEITVSRANADVFALVVPYTITAKVEGKGTEGTTWETPVDVTIPAGETSATLLVKPLVDASISEDIVVVVAAGAGKFNDFSPATLDMTIANVAFPAGYNTWSATADGLASDPNNWSEGHAPLADENVLFDGNFSSANCEWDSDATSTVASWTQRNGYTGTVTLKTVFPGKGDFTCLTVTGAMTIESGTLTHPQSVIKGDNITDPAAAVADLIANETYRIRISADTIVIGASGKIDVMGKGYYMNNSGNNTMPSPSHGGIISATGCQAYDDPKEPIHVGLPFKTGSGNYYVGKGGGAIYLTASGVVTVDGVICADSSDGSWAENARASGAAGSVYIRAASVTGTGSITASGLHSLDQNNIGVGGRIAIITETPVSRATFAKISADAEWKKNSKNETASNFGGCGTVFFKDKDHANGILVVAGKSDWPALSNDKIYRVTTVGTEGDWTFDAVEFGRGGRLVIPVGTALHLPNGFTSITGTSDDPQYAGIRYEGGTLDLGTTENQTMSGGWMFTPWTNYVFNGSLTVQSGAAIGVPGWGNPSDTKSTLPMFLSCNLEVTGDLTIASDGSAVARNCGFRKSTNSDENGVFGCQAHGGRTLHYGKTLKLHYQGYDSVFAPFLPGCGAPEPNGQGSEPSGGVIKLTVGGALTVDGKIDANGHPDATGQGGNDGGGVGGAIDITAGSLAGSGKISAEGGSMAWQRGAGGRVAVKLTDKDADFTAFTGYISASGRCASTKDASVSDTSSGTVYLKTGAEGEKSGTIVVKHRVASQYYTTNATNTTEIVSLGYGGDAVADYKNAKVEVRDYGFAAVNTDVRLAKLTLATTDAKLDLEGNTLTVGKFEYFANDVICKLAAGEYSFAQLSAIEGLNIVDTSAEQSGKVIIKPAGMKVILR